jgi:dTDP-4-dehydrorhamnose reductase
MSKVILIGHGYIGNAIKEELEAQSIDYTWIRHTDPIPTGKKSIINATGFTGVPNVDACELFKQETINGNVLYPLFLEQEEKCPIVHISSGCVYTGYDKQYTEEDEPNFNFSNGSFYSGSKALEQKLLEPYMNKSYLLRIRMPFSDDNNLKNLFSKLSRYDKLIDYENSLSYVPDVAKVAVEFAIKSSIIPRGVYNVCNPGSITTKQLADMLGFDKPWFTEKEFNDSVRAPRSNCVLNTDKLQKVFPIQSLEQALYNCISNYKQQ